MQIPSINLPSIFGKPDARANAETGNPFAQLLSKLLPAKERSQTVKQRGTGLPDALATTPSGGAVKEGLLRQTLSTHLDEFQKQLLGALSAAGINLNESFQIQADGFGDVQASLHYQGKTIESLFEELPELRSLFHLAAASFSYLSGHQPHLDDFQVSWEDGELRFGFH